MVCIYMYETAVTLSTRVCECVRHGQEESDVEGGREMRAWASACAGVGYENKVERLFQRLRAE